MTMAKGQDRGNREAKKPKATAKKPAAGTPASAMQPPPRPAPSKSGNK